MFVLCRFNINQLASYPREEWEEILQTYFKVAFVRHPFSRLVSAYRDKFEKKKIPGWVFSTHIMQQFIQGNR